MSAEIAAAQPTGWLGRTGNAAVLVLGRLPAALWWTAVVPVALIAAGVATLPVLGRRVVAAVWATGRGLLAVAWTMGRSVVALPLVIARAGLRGIRRVAGWPARAVRPAYWSPARIRDRRRARGRRVWPVLGISAAWADVRARAGLNVRGRRAASTDASVEQDAVAGPAKLRAMRTLGPWAARLRDAAAGEREAITARSGARLEAPGWPLPDEPDQRAQALVADPATRRSATYFVLALPLAVAGAALLTTSVLLGVLFTTFPLFSPLLDVGPQRLETPDGVYVLEGLDVGVGESILVAMLGLVVLALASGLARVFATAHVGLARALLTPTVSARLAAELAEQHARRRLAIAAAEAERRRIERDLHDGAQQRLTSLAISIGRARERLAADPPGAAALLDEAHGEAKRAIVEIRELARGIHPAILTDRGLDAALSALAGRAPFPVRIVTDLPARPPEAAESAAYFVVAEALTNAARHAAATSVTVSLVLSGNDLAVMVVDDGRGGADPDRGTGLAGLRERTAALGGRLTVDSPPGGPTVVRAELPCAS